MVQIQWKPPSPASPQLRCLPPPPPHAPTPSSLELGSYKCTYLPHKYSSVCPYKCVGFFCMLLSFDINDILHVFFCNSLFLVQHKFEIDHCFLCVALAHYSGWFVIHYVNEPHLECFHISSFHKQCWNSLRYSSLSMSVNSSLGYKDRIGISGSNNIVFQSCPYYFLDLSIYPPKNDYYETHIKNV